MSGYGNIIDGEEILEGLKAKRLETIAQTEALRKDFPDDKETERYFVGYRRGLELAISAISIRIPA